MPSDMNAINDRYAAHLKDQGAAIRKALRRRGLSQSKAAAYLGVPYPTFRGWCYGMRRCPAEIRARIVVEMDGNPNVLGPAADACPHCGRPW